MGPIYAFMLLAVLIGGSAIATDKANGAELPDEVILIHSEVQAYQLEENIFKEYLRRPSYEEFLPKAITYRVDCYSDGSGQVLKINGISGINRSLTVEGRDLLRVVIQNVGYYTCTAVWEELYESIITGESVGPWYF